jgi:hypothetical protein
LVLYVKEISEGVANWGKKDVISLVRPKYILDQ